MTEENLRAIGFHVGSLSYCRDLKVSHIDSPGSMIYDLLLRCLLAIAIPDLLSDPSVAKMQYARKSLMEKP